MKRPNENLHGDNPAFHVLPNGSDLAAQYLLLSGDEKAALDGTRQTSG